MTETAAKAHLCCIETIVDRPALAGPLYSDDGQRIAGSICVFKAERLDEARALLEADPHFAAGFWRSVDYRPFLPAAGAFVGGKTW